jgi:polyisoprenoid-binding protein YceI
MLSPTLAAFAGLTPVLKLQPESRLWVEGTSNVRPFTCEANAIDAQVETEQGQVVQRLVAGEKAVRTVVVTVPSKSLDCDNNNKKMNEHMLKAIKAEENPSIEFRLQSYELTHEADSANAILEGTLKLGGAEKPVTIKAATKSVADGVLQVTGAYELRMTDYGLKPPKLMMGAFKVNDPVRINFDLLLKE